MSIDKIKDGIVSAGKYVTENATKATNYASTKMSLSSKEAELEREYAKIGKEYYERSKNKEKSEFKQINKLKMEVENLNGELSDLKNIVICSKCGNKQDKENSYCSECGAKI